MIEIKNIVFTKYKLKTQIGFLCFINHLLPLKLKFLNESFIALFNGIKQGIITLDKDSKSCNRFKITQLILEKNSTLIAKQLINYAITRYRAMGATSFYVVVDEKLADLLDIFKNIMNFRTCGHEYLYKINSINTDYPFFLKSFKKQNVKEVRAFYNDSINSYNRFLFSREEYQFFNDCYKYVFFNDDRSKILGYFEVATKNNLDFYINFSIDCAYNIYFHDALKFIYFKISNKYKKFNLYVKIKDYFMNSKELLAILNENNTEYIYKSQILAKDYYKEIKQDNLLKTKIIFNDPTIA